MPPVARTTARARIAPTPSSAPSPSTCRVSPQARPSALRNRSRTRACSTSRIHGSRRTAACSARCTSAPVASPPACTIRSARCPPSRVSMSVPSGCRSNSAPSRISSRTRVGPSSTSTRTAAGSHSPTPAISVSLACAAGVSSGSSTAAIPPCAHRVDPSSMLTLVTTVTCRPCSRRCSAAVSPATPEPTTSTSVVSLHPGWAAASRRGSSGRSARVDIRSVHSGGRRPARRGRHQWPPLLVLDRETLGAPPLERGQQLGAVQPEVAANAEITERPDVLVARQ